MLKTPLERIMDKSLPLGNLLGEALTENVSPSVNDAEQVLLLVIDNQNDFMDNGPLGVPGALEDSKRLVEFIYANFEKITKIMCSLDTHSPTQIFFSSWWIDQDGNHPAPFTIISSEDVKIGKWKPVMGDLKVSIKYVEELEKSGKMQLCIWPYHCLKGGEGAALEEVFFRMVQFHATCRCSLSTNIQKGMDPYSEMYGIIKAEYDEKNFLNTPVLNAIEKYGKIVIAGQAKSHCVLSSLVQIVEYFSNRPEVLGKIYFLSDCTSCIPGYEDATEATLNELQTQYGIQLVDSSNLTL